MYFLELYELPWGLGIPMTYTTHKLIVEDLAHLPPVQVSDDYRRFERARQEWLAMRYLKKI
jgi:hypothetical protein